MPIQIGEVTVAAANNKIYVIGGSTADRVDEQLNQEYDIATNTWRNRAQLPRGLTHDHLPRGRCRRCDYPSA